MRMDQRRLRTLLGLAMVGLGALQTAIFALQGELIPMALGFLFALIGVAYLWVQVYSGGQ